MKHLKAINRKAKLLERQLEKPDGSAHALAEVPFGCSIEPPRANRYASSGAASVPKMYASKEYRVWTCRSPK